MKTNLAAFLIAMLLAGCSHEPPAAVEDIRSTDVSADQVLAIAERVDDLSDESFSIVCVIGAQLLSYKFEEYREAGFTDADFARMPDNELTNDIRRLYLVMQPLLE